MNFIVGPQPFPSEGIVSITLHMGSFLFRVLYHLYDYIINYPHDTTNVVPRENVALMVDQGNCLALVVNIKEPRYQKWGFNHQNYIYIKV
jgi:hypothetical protein